MEITIIPRFIIRKLCADETKQIHANVLITSVLVLAAFLLWHTDYIYLFSLPHFCIFQEILNIPCPGCGIMRSFYAIAGGDIITAWKFNPAGMLLFFYFLMQLPLRIVALKFHASKSCVSQISQFGSKIIIFVLLLVWIIRLV